MTTRNPNPELPPDGSAIISEVNFTTTRAGLTGQVLKQKLIKTLGILLRLVPKSCQKWKLSGTKQMIN